MCEPKHNKNPMRADLTGVVFDTLDRLSCARTPGGIVRAVKESAGELADADGVSILLRDGADIYSLDETSTEPICDGVRVPLTSCLSGWVVLRGSQALVADVDDDGRVAAIDLGGADARSVVVVPIRSADPIGALSVCWTEFHIPEDDVVLALQTLANAVAIAVENARLCGWVEVAYRSARQEARKYHDLVNAVNGVVWQSRPHSLRFTFVSDQAESLLGYPLADWTASESFWLDHVYADDRLWAAEFRRGPVKAGGRHRFEYRMVAADGHIVWVADYLSVGRNSDNSECLHGVIVDISEQKTLERQLARHALYDPLTGLPNRALFLDHAEKEVLRANRNSDSLAVLFIDLDRFKHINDSFGHLAGDALLMAVSARLRRSCRGTETVARLAGDEFAILAPGAGSPEKARTLADRIHMLFAQPFNIAGSALYLTASIGIALSHGVRHPARDLLRQADTATYRAKNAGRARTEFFDASMHADVLSRLRLETELRQAVSRGEFAVHYQSIVSLSSRVPIGFEALLRWPHPGRGLLQPGEFLLAAEDLGLLRDLGYQTLAMVCSTLRRWNQRSSDQPWISVNLSPVQLHDPNLFQRVHSLLEANSVAPHCLKLEITEAAVVQSEASIHDSLHQLHNIGVGILIDDFGTGTSSFSRLLDAPVDVIKIDRRFIEEIAVRDASAPLLRSIMSLGRNLDVGLIAEGVENEVQFEGLRKLGCDAAQGFYFSRPAPLDQVERLIA